MSTCRFIICEKTSHWAPGVRRALRGEKMPLVQTPSLTTCAAALDEAPASVVAIEITAANLETAIEFINSGRTRHPHSAVVGLLSSDMATAESLLREAGVIDVVTSVIDVPRIGRLALRHWQQVPRVPQTLRQSVAERLPWPAHARNANPG